ncbi:bifunctional hydroxymethylpyrimidine kinase/phosphomethylpyrimidine kinase [Pleomorphovibrio marinus]|uniref:bifunctional hydroxymethylpyrimidine kinase/phosphomethylpyrimidine kinase n=1 Tax=Pleomorphovibrio marinus TaxID=2164132 RepID=UPI000E0A4BA9|nr:bifunctional hydroxymethylpyrimidine kinase/phosphomethylpyrimidine kinase [Pleomorphovibrio marinus]
MLKKTYIPVLTIAGSDSGGGAGIQADIKTISALGCYAASAITAITVQNTVGVRAIHALPMPILDGQIKAVMEDIAPKAIKIGMVDSPEVVEIIVSNLLNYPDVPVVFDPVMVATSGDKLIQDETIEVIVRLLFPLVDIITPNLDEAMILTHREVKNKKDMLEAADKLLESGAQGVLVKGGHLQEETIYDVLAMRDEEIHVFKSSRIHTHNTHGTGCSLSSAVAAELGKGRGMVDAVINARTYIFEALLQGKDQKTGSGHGPLNHFHNPIKTIINELDD